MLEEQKPMDDRYLFLVIGILASLRAVQHMLVHHDRKLSPQHKAAIGEWKKLTSKNLLIEKSRNMILKEGTFPGGAGFRQAELDPDGTVRRVPRRWEAFYYVDGKPRDLIADMRAAAGWCEAQLSSIEPHVPAINMEGDSVTD
jgi:hypothetical protein